MNAETGRIYEGDEAIEAAEERGEPLIELAPQIYHSLAMLEWESNQKPRSPADDLLADAFAAAAIGGQHGTGCRRL